MKRRPPTLPVTIEPERRWRVRTLDGRLLEPLGTDQVQTLVEAGLAGQESGIAPLGSDAWQPLGEHPLWREIAPPRRAFKLTAWNGERVVSTPPPMHTTPAMQARWDAVRAAEQEALMVRNTHEDTGRMLQALGFASAVAGWMCFGDLIVFTCDLALAFVLLLGLTRFLALWFIWRVMK